MNTNHSILRLRTEGEHDIKQLQPHLTEDEQSEFTRLGAQEIVESSRISGQEETRKDLLDRQKTLQNDLESLSTLIESNQSQKQGQFIRDSAQFQLLKTCS